MYADDVHDLFHSPHESPPDATVEASPRNTAAKMDIVTIHTETKVVERKSLNSGIELGLP